MTLLKLLFSECFGKNDVVRTPEPDLVMDHLDNVAAFHRAGDPNGLLIPIYYFSAVTCSRMLPKGSRVLDLGSGSGQYLSYLAKGRPDLEIVGLDLSRSMIDLGNEKLKEQGLFPRVRLQIGDMTDFLPDIEGRFDLISTMFALHHLPTAEALEKCLFQIIGMLHSQQSSLWIFDHARPRTMTGARMFNQAFLSGVSQELKQDSFNSTLAAWSFTEIQKIIKDQGDLPIKGWLSRVVPFWQIHHLIGPHAQSHHELWVHPVPLDAKQRSQVRLFENICFPAVK